MSKKTSDRRTLPPAARVYSSLQAEEALLPGEASALRRSGALFLALLVLAATPLYLAANAAGLIGDAPAALAKGSNSGPGGGDDDSSGPGSGDDDDDDVAEAAKTDDTSANGASTRGTTNDNDTRTRLGTDDTSGQNSTRGTTNDNDTNTNTRNSATGTQTRTQGQTQTRTRTGS
ncbi:MAG TPA: hypothetical protein VFY48_01075 [Solirubrobacterales bacterium]|nr:hypothetical protein [Solirubrobacterales bacterium]